MKYSNLVKQYKSVCELSDNEEYQLQKIINMEHLTAFAKKEGLVPLTKNKLNIIGSKQK